MVEIGTSGLFVDPTKFVDKRHGRTYTSARVEGVVGPMGNGIVIEVEGVHVSLFSRTDCSAVHFVGKTTSEFFDSHTLQKVAKSPEVEVWADWIRAELKGRDLE